MQAVILAGGSGTRLRPYTAILPKPLMPIGERAILEIIILQLKYYGFRELIFTVGYLGELVEAYFGNGKKWGLKIRYSREKKQLGTAGPLTLIKSLNDNFIVLNGDILTNLNFRNLFLVHCNNNNDITICTYLKKIKIDLGVLEIKHHRLTDYIEKPEYSFEVSTGIYALKRKSLKRMRFDAYCNFPDLIKEQIAAGAKIGLYPLAGKWFDIGRLEDYQLACSEFEINPNDFLKIRRGAI